MTTVHLPSLIDMCEMMLKRLEDIEPQDKWLAESIRTAIARAKERDVLYEKLIVLARETVKQEGGVPRNG